MTKSCRGGENVTVDVGAILSAHMMLHPEVNYSALCRSAIAKHLDMLEKMRKSN